ncbi:MAG: hypothetical protein Fur0037_09120 [Planctomycetota bacterium]
MADDEERRLFADAERTLAMEGVPAAPPNRFRRVLRLEVSGRTYYLKVFSRTQWKNRLRNRFSEPKAADDAEREARVTMALRREGIETPRPVATARSAAGKSFYLCAEMPGMPLRMLLARGAISSDRARIVADFCGDVLRKGYRLPDLSAEHVYVRLEVAFLHIGILDLHNGTLAAPGPPPRSLLSRVLRHFRKSVEGLGLPWPAALRFAVQLLHAAGRRAEVREILSGLPQFDTASRYRRPGRARAYSGRSARRAESEIALLKRVWPGRPGETVLDCPSGAGRLLPLLRGELLHRVFWIDAAMPMIDEARLGLVEAPPCAVGDALRLPLADRAVDGVVVMRFLHHLEPGLARRALAEAARVARRFVVVSFFHPVSIHGARRRLARFLARGSGRRHALRLGRIRSWMLSEGFVLDRRAAELPFARDLWIASFTRSGARGDSGGRG